MDILVNIVVVGIYFLGALLLVGFIYLCARIDDWYENKEYQRKKGNKVKTFSGYYLGAMFDRKEKK